MFEFAPSLFPVLIDKFEQNLAPIRISDDKGK